MARKRRRALKSLEALMSAQVKSLAELTTGKDRVELSPRARLADLLLTGLLAPATIALNVMDALRPSRGQDPGETVPLLKHPSVRWLLKEHPEIRPLYETRAESYLVPPEWSDAEALSFVAHICAEANPVALTGFALREATVAELSRNLEVTPNTFYAWANSSRSLRIGPERLNRMAQWLRTRALELSMVADLAEEAAKTAEPVQMGRPPIPKDLSRLSRD